MKFSDRKHLRRCLSLILTVCLVASLLAGCFGSSSDETTGSTTSGLSLNLDTGTTAETTETAATEPTEEINENTGVALSGIHVRSTPSQDANVVATLAAGDRVEIVRQEELLGITWGYITDPVGWVVMDYIQMDMEQEDTGSDTSTPAGNGETTTTTNSDDTTTTTTSIKGTVTANGLYIRSEASKTSTVQGSYSKGDTVTILETKNGWGRTDKGWINMDYVQTTGTTTTTTNTTTTTTGSTVTSNGSTTVQFKGIVTASELNIRTDASQTADKVGSYTYGDRVEFYQKDGNWGRTDKGWISLSYVYQDGTTGSNTATGTVTATELRVRSGPGTGYDVVGSYTQGDAITVLEQFTYGNTTWGCTKTGWVSMDYVSVTGSTGTGTVSSTTTTSTETQQSGTVTADGLRIRSGAGTGYDVVGSYNSGDSIYIYETTTVDGTTWGRTGSGWVSMAYVTLS